MKELLRGKSQLLVIRSFLVFLLLAILLLKIGFPSYTASLAKRNVTEKFYDISLEARVEGQSNSVHVTQTFLVKTNHQKIKRGLILNFPSFDRTYSPAVGPNSYEFLEASIQRQADKAGATSPEFPIAVLKPQTTSGGVSLKIGDDSVELSPGLYKFTLKYKIKNAIFSLNKAFEGFRIVVAKPYGFIADNISVVFYPPAVVTMDSIKASAYAEERILDDENTYLRKASDLESKVDKDPVNVNRFGEPSPFVWVRPKRVWSGEENLALVVEWPKGFVIKETS